MANDTKDIQRVGDLYRGLTGTKKSDRPEDIEGQQERAAEGSTFQSDLDENREETLRAQQESADKYRDDRHAAIDKADKSAKKSTAKKAAKKTAAKKS